MYLKKSYVVVRIFRFNCHVFKKLTFLPILCNYNWKMEWVLSFCFCAVQRETW